MALRNFQEFDKLLQHSLQVLHIYFEKQKVSTIKNIVWATGYRPNFEWIEGLELDKDHYPKNFRGVSGMTGLYFLGLPWMYTRGSATLGGVSKDASYLAEYMLNEELKIKNY